MFQLSAPGVGAGLVFIFAGCEPANTDTSPHESTRAQTRVDGPQQGGVAVAVVVNRAPEITSLSASSGRITFGKPILLAVTASDPDGDALAFRWQGSCPGTFADTELAQTVFTTNVLSSAPSCEFDVVVDDGHGARGLGTLVLTTREPIINVAPQMGPAYQSTDRASMGEAVLLHASASDPEGESLTWRWQADAGELFGQRDENGGSSIEWVATAPRVCSITATAIDAEGASTDFVFTVLVAD